VASSLCLLVFLLQVLPQCGVCLSPSSHCQLEGTGKQQQQQQQQHTGSSHPASASSKGESHSTGLHNVVPMTRPLSGSSSYRRPLYEQISSCPVTLYTSSKGCSQQPPQYHIPYSGLVAFACTLSHCVVGVHVHVRGLQHVHVCVCVCVRLCAGCVCACSQHRRQPIGCAPQLLSRPECRRSSAAAGGWHVAGSSSTHCTQPHGHREGPGPVPLGQSCAAA
jgi:hypothetical protein